MLTQLLFQYAVYRVIYAGNTSPGETRSFYLLLAAGACIAAGGYIINDYFDLDIDQVNKPDRVIVNTIISRRWVILWHLILSIVGMTLSFYAVPLIGYWPVVLGNIASVVLLVIYSTALKKKLLVGNVLISLLTAWVIGVIFLSKIDLGEIGRHGPDARFSRLFRLTVLYMAFAFIISLVREAVKDMEDMEGDRKYGCRTMPIVWGLTAAKVFTGVWLAVLGAAVAIMILYVLQLGWWWSVVYCVVGIFIPLVWICRKLFDARTPAEFHRLSSAIKLVMLAGIVSMIFVSLYH